MSRFIRPGPGWDSDPRVPRAADAADREVITAAADWLRSNGPADARLPRVRWACGVPKAGLDV
jgi:hypothetical protein